ncbi:hypothetical protein [Synechococcus sp. RSCCF101]|uniref:tyrosine-type recombinase/integrase n=1 Tax=Synechococcus sp. RSCCF101 TaxID=2511069 RepID=UPI0012488CCB|nr:hypothetical protein [Synechococcus sp. RSCCF101]
MEALEQQNPLDSSLVTKQRYHQPITWSEPVVTEDGEVAEREVRGYTEELTKPSALRPPELTWEEAVEIHRERHRHRTGADLSEAWGEKVAKAIQYMRELVPIRAEPELEPEPASWGGPNRPARLEPQHVRAYIKGLRDKKKLSANSIETSCALLSGVLTSLKKTGECPDIENPFSQVDYTTRDKGHLYSPTKEDYRRIGFALKEMDPRYATTIRWLAFTGMRLNELLTRQPEDYDEENHAIRIGPRDGWKPKTSTSNRVIPTPEDFVCLGNKGRARGGWASGFSIAKQLKQVNPRLSAHSLRHGWKTAAREAGADEIMSELYLGHRAGSEMSRTYGEVTATALRREAMKVWAVMEEWMR